MRRSRKIKPVYTACQDIKGTEEGKGKGSSKERRMEACREYTDFAEINKEEEGTNSNEEKCENKAYDVYECVRKEERKKRSKQGERKGDWSGSFR